MLVLIILAVVWVAVLLPPFLRSRRDARPDNSVVSFRAQLSTLERATPGTSLRRGDTGKVPAVTLSSLPRTSTDVRRRRREVLAVLVGASVVSSLLLILVSGTVTTVLFLASVTGLGAYLYALRQIHVRATERVAKVRPLVRPQVEPVPALVLRRTASR